MVKTEKSKKKTAKNKTVKLLKKPTLEKLSKTQVTKILYPITLDEAVESFNKLRAVDCNKINILDKIGVDFVNHFTSIERLNTNGRLNFSFFDVYFPDKFILFLGRRNQCCRKCCEDYSWTKG